MKAAVDNDVAGIVADCGGAMTCATCHVYVDEAWQSRVGPPSELETSMLECVVDPQPNSRLSCQITITEALDGLVLHLPKRQF
jgi:2Fe-2S ferredoxin